MITNIRPKIIVLLLFQFFSVAPLFAQAPLNQTQADNSTAQFPEAITYANSDLTFNIIDVSNNTFSYDVYAGGKLMIHQTSVPGLPGNEGFKTREDAVKVAGMVLEKIRKGEMPPTVTLEEMKQVGVIE